MKIETLPLDNHQVKITVQVDAQPFEDAKHRAARKLARQTKIPGFRPGKAPYAMIVRHIGEGAIVEEAMDILVNDIYPDVIKEANIQPYGPGSLENIPSIDPPVLEFVVPLKATAELGNYKELRQTYELNEISDEDVEKTIKELRERQAVNEPVDRPAQEGDLVHVRLSAERAETAEDQSSTLIRERPAPVVIEPDNGNEDEWPFPGFSRLLIGLSANEEKTFPYTYPEDSDYETLRGTQANFKVKVERVNARTIPELDDDFAKSVGEYETVEELRKAVRKDMEEYAKEKYHNDYDSQVLDAIVDMSTIKYPPQMMEEEMDNVIERIKKDLSQQNLDIDLYLKSREMDMNGLREEVKPVAEKRLKRTITLLELAEKEGIKVNPDELQTETNRALGEMASVMNEKDMRKLVQTREMTTSLVSNIMMDMLIDKTQDRIREIARGAYEGQASELVETNESEVNPPQAAPETEDEPAESTKLANDTQPESEPTTE